MSTVAQRRAAAHARAVKAASGSKKGILGLTGLSLGNLGKIKKEEAVSMLSDTGAIIVGLVAQRAGSALIKKHVTKGDEAGLKKWIPTLVSIGGGFAISAMGKDKKVIASIGKGLMAGGSIDAVEAVTGKNIMELVGFKETNSGTNTELERTEGFQGLADIMLPEIDERDLDGYDDSIESPEDYDDSIESPEDYDDSIESPEERELRIDAREFRQIEGIADEIDEDLNIL